jgi:hypothetical protein
MIWKAYIGVGIDIAFGEGIPLDLGKLREYVVDGCWNRGACNKGKRSTS